MIPGRINRSRVQADAPGVFRGQCAEYCRAQHANMALVAREPAEYAAWVALDQPQPAHQPGPACKQFSSGELRAPAACLESLK
jgi:cytochrome c oxidase subunit 2